MQRADKRTYHYIYKITRFDGKYYIGMHSTSNLEDGYFGSGKLITRSIKKYGKEKHSKEILEYLPSRIELKDREKELITEEIVNDPLCMNLQLGGGGGFINEEHKLKFIKAGTEASVERRRGDPEFKKIVYDKILKTLIERNSFRRVPGSWKFATINAAKPEAILKRKETFKDRAHQQGEKNSQFGVKRISLNKDGITKRINIKELQKYIDSGWSPKVKKLSNLQLKYQVLEKKFTALRPKCRNFKCSTDLTFKQFCSGNTSCSKACSNASRNMPM